MKKVLKWIGNKLLYTWKSVPKVWVITLLLALIVGITTLIITGSPDMAVRFGFFSFLTMAVFFIGYVNLRQLWWYWTKTGDYEDNNKEE